MTSFLAMVKGFLKMTVRNRTALFWNLIFPVIFILVFGTVFSQSDFSSRVGLSGAPSEFHSEVAQALDSSDVFDVSSDKTTDQQLEQLKDGDRDVVLVFGDEPAGGGFPTVQLYYDEAAGPNSQISVNAIRQVLNTVAQGPSPVTIEATTGPDAGHLVYGLSAPRYPGHGDHELRGDRALHLVRDLPRARHSAAHQDHPVSTRPAS